MSTEARYAPGWPGIAPRWTSSAKSGVGASLCLGSRVWFTISHGILDEVYYPRVDQACVRDLGLIVTDGQYFFSEEKHHTNHQLYYPVPGCPAYQLINTCEQGRYTIKKDVLADPWHDVVLQRVQFTPSQGVRVDYHLYALLAPHLGNRGAGNTAWVGDYKGVPMLFAEREGNALALACSAPWGKRSAGFVSTSDGWQDLTQHKQMTWTYPRAENGNVALTGEIDLSAVEDSFVLALGFGRNSAEAGYRVLASLQAGFEAAQSAYEDEWRDWQSTLSSLERANSKGHNLYRVSTVVLRSHEDKRFRGGVIASLSIPWGSSKGDDDLGGYHLVWPRDLVEIAGGFLAAGAAEDARRIIQYLETTQEADGHWPQNMWLNGTAYWSGIQMDETAFPILLIDLARREEALSADELERFWPMVRRAVGFLVRNGPVTPEDRWEEDPGYSPFTLAVEIAALLVAADLADAQDKDDLAAYLRETADAWNNSIEKWTYVTGTDLAKQVGVEGYYVRIAPPEAAEGASPAQGFVPIKNRPPAQSTEPTAEIVSPDALALVRFGLRGARDPRIVNTVKVIDALLKVDTPTGSAWHRYNDDGYGEHDDGSPFDGTGTGRAWPLLTGERAHYELAAGRKKEAARLLGVLETFASDGGMFPEQIWDAADIPERGLLCGRPSGSAMPLTWVHAEYIKLCRSLHDGHVFDTPPQTVQRYQAGQARSQYTLWRFNNKRRTIPPGSRLRLEVTRLAKVHWSPDGWQTTRDAQMRDTGLGVYVADLPTGELEDGDAVVFTFYWLDTDRWQGENFTVKIVG
jgi:glucoamylase